MGQSADRDQIHARFGDGGDRVERDAARGFADHAAGDSRHRLAEKIGRHIVEQYGVDAFRENLLQLIERVDFDLDLHEMTDVSLGGAQRRRDAAGRSSIRVGHVDFFAAPMGTR